MPELHLKRMLQQGLDSLSLSLPESAQDALLAYLHTLMQWNKAYNLTAVHDPQQMVIRHLLDSLAFQPYLPQQSPLLDVGTGAGLPGLVLAIANPKLSFYLLDSLGKRIVFLQKVVRDLGLKNVEIIESRVEAYTPGFAFAVIMSRAFSSLAQFIALTAHLSDQQTYYCAFKGKLLSSELDSVQGQIKQLTIHALTIPHLDAERHVLIFNKSEGSPA